MKGRVHTFGKGDQRKEGSSLRKCDATSFRSQVVVRIKCVQKFRVHGLFNCNPGLTAMKYLYLPEDMVTSARQPLATVSLPWLCLGTETGRNSDFFNCAPGEL